MQIVASVILKSGLEMVSFIDGLTSVPKIDEHGTMRANNILGELVEIKHLTLENPLKSMAIPTPQGVANMLAPVAQTSTTQVDAVKVHIAASDVMFIDSANEQIEGQYRQQFSKIALPTGAGRLGLIK